MQMGLQKTFSTIGRGAIAILEIELDPYQRYAWN
tara:strand:+ start:146 stop:247 length:102 start_codon:yes stop_codon:yes gene_type:complete